MANFSSDLQSLRSSSSFPFLDIDPNMEPINQFTEMNQPIIDNPNLNFLGFFPFSNDNFGQQTPEFSGCLASNFPGIFHQYPKQAAVVPVSHASVTTVGNQSEFHESRKRKAVDLSESSSMNSSPQASECGIKMKNSSRRGKRVKRDEEEEKPKEVVHVRARRGQATDSHSLAERARRGKINERLRCLQDIVPGCYKTMGMAVMLDEIINYVQSLQNQIEFLSMKLTAASAFYDFNADNDAIESMQRAKAKEAKEMEKVMREGHGGLACYHSSWSL